MITRSAPLRLLSPLLIATALGAADTPASAPAAPPTLQWQPIVHGLGGSSWGPGGVSLVVIDPDSHALFAGVSGSGLWRSADSGATWAAMGAIDDTKGKPSCVLFDTAKPGNFWVGIDAGMPSLFVTSDGGTTFKHIPDLEAVASFSVDLEDPKHKLMAAGLATRNHEVRISTTGGSVFSRAHFPADLGLCREVAVVGPKAILVGSHGHDDKDRKQTVEGIWLSTDAGHTWSKVSEASPSAHLVALADGTLLWPCGEHESIMRSKDHGHTWTALNPAAQYAPTLLHGTWMGAIGGGKLMLSSDLGETWDAVGGPLPVSADGLAWDEPSHAFISWHSTDAKEKDAVMRLVVPADLELLANPVMARDLIGWDGSKSAGGGWPAKPETSLTAQTKTTRHGKAALAWQVALKSFFTNCGWLWGNYPLNDADTVDASGMSKLVLSLQLVGTEKEPAPAGLPTQIHCSLASLSGGAAVPSKQDVDLLKVCPKLVDGKWHDVAIPLADFGTADLKKMLGLNLTANNATNDFGFCLYIDDIGFAR